MASIPRVIIAGTGSGCGKTTVACAVLGALQGRRPGLRAFKCGPDYIDPMFHKKILGVPSRNLDSFLCGEETLKYLFARSCPGGTLAVIEGVMGFYDGLGGSSMDASTYHVAQILQAPVLLVMSCKGKSLSIAAELQGFLRFAPNTIAGVILNGATEGNYPMYQRIIQEHTAVPVLGYLPRIPEAELESRHLGLVTANEVDGLRDKMRRLAVQAEQTLDLDRLLEIAAGAPELSYEPVTVSRVSGRPPHIGVAWDNAFCFYYQDNLDLLQQMGAKLIHFSPLSDRSLPAGLSGLLLGGGYPELYARSLGFNRPLLEEICAGVRGGLPTIAECGGFLFLCRQLKQLNGETSDMSGALDATAQMTGRLGNFGYVILTAERDNLLCEAGGQIRAHEYHYSQASSPGDGFTARKPGGRAWKTGYAGESYYAGYPHLHLWSNPDFASRFLRRCVEYGETSYACRTGN